MAALAAHRATRQDMESLEAILEEQERQIVQGESGANADTAFHTAVAAASHNQALTRLGGMLVDLLAPIRDESLQTPERSRRSLRSHRTILDTIRRRDSGAAREAMTEHTESVSRALSQRPPNREI